MANHSRPYKITLRAYQVGFGDCFLLTFHYNTVEGAPDNRHVLIDFGSTEKPDGAPPNLPLLIAEDIREKCRDKDGTPKLHAVVATHRHADHISGFTTAAEGKKKASGDIIAECQPQVVIQPWTENPDAASDATSKTTYSTTNAFVSAMRHMHSVSKATLAELRRLRVGGCSKSIIEQLEFLGVDNLGEENLSNRSAVENLRRMGEKHFYVHHGSESGLEDLLPGVRTHVLGPPTLEQSEAIRKQRSSDKDEFWQLRFADWQVNVAEGLKFWSLQAAAGRDISSKRSSLFADSLSCQSSQMAPSYTRWFIRRMNALRGEQLLEIVRSLDKVMNNTSIILLFEVGDKKLLFPGDAQIESWAYALKEPKNKAATETLLRGVSLYKVGHHGSRNATPKTLWAMVKPQNVAPSHAILQTVVSTKAGKHGHEKDATEVPRLTLVEELRKSSSYFSTQQLRWNKGDNETAISEVFEIIPDYPPQD